MPHYKDGRAARQFDRVRFQTGTTYPAADAEGKRPDPVPNFSEGRVIDVADAPECELTLVVGSFKVMGQVNRHTSCAEHARGEQPFNAVIVEGYYTHASAKDCEFVPEPA